MLTINQTKITLPAGSHELFIIREFNAPREIVFKAFSEPEYFAQWLVTEGMTMTLDKMESRNGGMWRYIHTDSTGKKYVFHGVFHEITPPERIVSTFEFEGTPDFGYITLETVKFEELPGDRTKVIAQFVFQSVILRDVTFQSGMEKSTNEWYERLDELLDSGSIK